jgi:hypothetical protein
MKKMFYVALLLLLFNFDGFSQGEKYEYLQISAVESVVPGGFGRSRLITTGKDGQVMETDLKNFYSLVGINFKNIQNNDKVIVDRLNELAQEGWELVAVTSGVESSTEKTGLFITRYLFRRLKK